MIRLFLFLPLCGLGLMLSGQSISSSLLSSTGALASDPSFGTLAWSVGETVISTLDPTPGSGPILTQGFHQVYVSNLVDTKDLEDDLLCLVYPNPTHDQVVVESSEPVQIRLINMVGLELIPFGDLSTFQTLTLSDIPSGTYLLEIGNKSYNRIKFSKLIIVQ